MYRSQDLEIDDRHIEIIVAQMLRHVRVYDAGDTGLQPGTLMDRFTFSTTNDRLKDCVKIQDPGEGKYTAGEVVSQEAFTAERTRLEAERKKPPTSERPLPATCVCQLLGISQVLKLTGRE